MIKILYHRMIHFIPIVVSAMFCWNANILNNHVLMLIFGQSINYYYTLLLHLLSTITS